MTTAQTDLCSGLALLYMGPKGESDEYVERLRTAMDTDNLDEAEHVSAVLLMLLNVRGQAEKWMFEKWSDVWHPGQVMGT